MILDKIPRIECVLIIPELITGELDNLIKEFDSNSKSLKILKKYKKRIRTYNYFKNLLNFSKESDERSNEFELVSKLFSDPNNSEIISNTELFNSFINSLDLNDKIILTKFIINHIDRIINKYIKILVHMDDQVFVLSKLNKDNKKIFLKFFLPKIIKKKTGENLESGSKDNDISSIEDESKNIFDGTINSLKDNIHMTLLPTIDGHGLDGIFHLTFRVEGKKSVVFEYSKFASINIDSNKLGVGIYPDEKCTDALIFKIIQNLSKLVEIIKFCDFKNFDNSILNLLIYNNMLEYLSLDIINQLNSNNKLEYIFEKYFYSLGKETIKTIIDKLFKIVIFTFVELYFGIGK
jgi:hypothetical protein